MFAGSKVTVTLSISELYIVYNGLREQFDNLQFAIDRLYSKDGDTVLEAMLERNAIGAEAERINGIIRSARRTPRA